MTTEKEADCCAFHPVYLVNPVSLSFCSYTLRFALTARREVADACGDAHGWIEGLDLHPTELAVARFVERRVVERVLVAQIFGHLGVEAIQPGEDRRLVEPADGSGSQ